MQNSYAQFFVVLAVLTWIFFATACLAHAVYHFKAAGLLDKPDPRESILNPPRSGMPPGPPKPPRSRGGWRVRR